MNVTTIDLNGTHLRLYMAERPAEWKTGLIGKDLGRVDGMLFRFPHDVLFPFHLKGLSTPILVSFFAGNGGFIGLNYLEPPTKTCHPERHYRYALELIGEHATIDGALKLVEPLAAGLGACL